MEYAPLIQSATPVRRAALGPYMAVLLGDITSVGAVRYEHVVAVFREGVEEPVLYLAAEINSMNAVFGGGSHFFGMFDDDGHHNLGASDRWADREAFWRRALDVLRERFDVPPEPHAT